MPNDKTKMPMITLTLKIKVPKAAYDVVRQWAKDNDLPGTVNNALARGAEQHFASMYLESRQTTTNLTAPDGSPLIVPPGGVHDA